jgi:predicted amidophosphoribosyltransferase
VFGEVAKIYGFGTCSGKNLSSLSYLFVRVSALEDCLRHHASEGASILAKILGVETVALQIEPRVHYKSKGRVERSQAQRMLGCFKVVEGERVWFYDDVITTGSTAKAVWAALGKPQEFQAVALVHRERTAMAESF